MYILILLLNSIQKKYFELILSANKLRVYKLLSLHLSAHHFCYLLSNVLTDKLYIFFCWRTVLSPRTELAVNLPKANFRHRVYV